MTRAIMFASFLLYLAAGEAAAQEVDLADWKNCRGVNYTITGSSNPIDQWLEYDEIAAEDNLDTLQAYGVNAVRVFGSYSVWDSKNWPDYTGAIDYGDHLQDFATKVFDREMVLMLVLFDSIGGAPTTPQGRQFGMTYLEYDASRSAWIRSPPEIYDPATHCWPTQHIGMPPAPIEPDPVCMAEYVDRRNQYIADTVTTVDSVAQAGDTVVYDLWNEPAGAGLISRSLFKEINEVIKVDLMSPGLTTVGTVNPKQAKRILDVMAPGGSSLDVLSYHPYAIFEEVVELRHAEAEMYADLYGIPHVITEIVHHGVGADCGHVLDWLTRLQHGAGESPGEGFFLWEGFASETQFATEDGIFYEGMSGLPVVRDLEGVNKLLTIAIEDGFQPQAVATLRPEGTGFIEYSPVPYEVTSPEIHDLLVDWNDQYFAETYRQTVWNAYTEYETAYDPATEPDSPARAKFNAVLDFYEETFHWAESGLSDDFVDFSVAEESTMDDLAADLAEIMKRDNPGDISDQEMMDLEDHLTLVATTILGQGIAGSSLIGPPNSPPEIVSFEASAQWVANGPLLQVEMTAKLIVNDLDRLSDLTTVDIQYSTDGGATFTGLGLPWMSDSGSIQETVAIPGLNPGQSFISRGFVEDNDGERAHDDITLLPTGPF